MHIVLYYTHDTAIFSSDPVIYYLILAILVRAQSNFVPDFTGTGQCGTGQCGLFVDALSCHILLRFKPYSNGVKSHYVVVLFACTR